MTPRAAVPGRRPHSVPRRRLCVGVFFVALVAGLAPEADAQLPTTSTGERIHVSLPTSSTAFWRDPDAYFTPTDKPEDGLRSAPWQGGTYGYVRNAYRRAGVLVHTRFHEGMDVSPRFRDDRGEPLDTVVAISDGRVVYVNHDARASSYGRYVVVEHRWQGSLYYSLYAHLESAWVYPSQYVRERASIGRLGYTGTGIDRKRAHVHAEVNLYLSDGFDAWMARYHPRDRNEHGRWNGQNLAAFDVLGFYRALDENPRLDLGAWLRTHQPVAFTVAVPGHVRLDLVRRYPWLLTAPIESAPPSYEIAFAGSGLPLSVRPREVGTATPFVLQVSPRVRYQGAPTNGLLTKRGDAYDLSTKGRAYIDLVTRSAPGIGWTPTTGD